MSKVRVMVDQDRLMEGSTGPRMLRAGSVIGLDAARAAELAEEGVVLYLRESEVPRRLRDRLANYLVADNLNPRGPTKDRQ